MTRCYLCGRPVDVREPYFREMRGWLRSTEAGGGQIVAREGTGRIAHSSCVKLLTHGVAMQESLA